jgi:hypothetical protein
MKARARRTPSITASARRATAERREPGRPPGSFTARAGNRALSERLTVAARLPLRASVVGDAEIARHLPNSTVARLLRGPAPGSDAPFGEPPRESRAGGPAETARGLGLSPTRSPRLQRDLFDGAGTRRGFDCNLLDMFDPSFDDSRSCCDEEALTEIRGLYTSAREHAQRAIGHVAAGANVDGQIVRHFGTDALWSRDQILRNLRTVLAHLDFDRHEHLCRPRNSDFCQLPEAARAEICGTRMTLCLSELAGEDRPLVVGGWATVLHEVVHLACIGDLPEFRLASPEQRRRGEFETYYHDRGS